MREADSTDIGRGTALLEFAGGDSRLSTAVERVVFVLTQTVREQFLPDLDVAALPKAEYHFVDVPASRPFDFEEVLRKLQPTVLVLGWRSPTIPASYALSESLPLRYVCHLSGTVKRFVPRQLIERGVIVSNWGSSISYTIAEHALLLTLASLRKLPMWPAMMKCDREQQKALKISLPIYSLRGRRVGLHGFGAIARELVGLLRPFKVKLSSYSHNVPLSLFKQHGVHACQSLEELFSNSEVLIECEALTSASQNSVTEDLLRLLPKEATFINVGRGSIVDEDALVRISQERQLRLGLDVFRKEPLAMDSPLRELPDTVLSPHIGGPTLDARQACGQFALDNVCRFLSGQNVEAQVTLDIYDRIT